MWEQFLAEPWVRVAASPLPTVLTFKRGGHPGWSTSRRLEILERWSSRVATPEGADAVREAVIDALWSDWSHSRQALSMADAMRPTVRTRRAVKRGRRLTGRAWRKVRAVTGR